MPDKTTGQDKLKTAVAILGWIGTGLLLSAYFLNQGSWVTTMSPLYQWMNLLGGAWTGISAHVKRNWPLVALEYIWATIALGALCRL